MIHQNTTSVQVLVEALFLSLFYWTMVPYEVPDFDGSKDESPWIFVKWLNEMEQVFE